MLLIALIAYLVGAIPTGFIVCRLKGINDIRKHGSGNIGATNVSRVLGKKFFLLILFIDGLKAFLFLFFLSYLNLSLMTLILSSVALLVGNRFSCFLKFSGGKGVGVSLGVFLALCPAAFLSFIFFWIVLFFVTKVVGVASVVSMILMPIVGLCFRYDKELFFLICFMACWTLYTHHNNITKFLIKIKNRKE